MMFLNAELNRLDKTQLANPVIDTLTLAKKKFPGMPASLDALCKRYQISLEEREYHGALLDARLLSCVYEHLKESRTLTWTDAQTFVQGRKRTPRPPRPAFENTPQDMQAIAQINERLGIVTPLS